MIRAKAANIKSRKPDDSSLDKKFFKKVWTSKDLFIVSLYIS